MSRPPITTPCHKGSRVFVYHLEPSRQLRCTVVSHRRWPPASALIGVAPVGFWSRPLDDEVLEQAALLSKLPLPNACRGGHCLALPACACSRVDRVRWPSPSCRVARLGSNAPSTTPAPAAKGKCQARVASTRGRCSSRSLRRLHPRVRALLTGRGRALAAKAEPSRPPHPPSTHAAIKGAFPMHFVHATSFLSIGKLSPCFPRSLSAAVDVDNPPHCLSLPLCRSRGPFIT
jgi:hypothetical protein